KQDLEFYAALRSEYAIRRADVCLLVLDAAAEVGQVDKKLAHYCVSGHKPTVLVVNKWDLAKGQAVEQAQYTAWLRAQLPQLAHAPVVYTSALLGRNVTDVLPLARELHGEYHQRVPTATLNDLITGAVRRRRPKRVGASATKIYYATQAGTAPPTFLVFVNRTDWIEPGYSRYLENFLRKHLPFQRVPYRVVFKARESQYHEHSDQHVRKVAATKADRQAQLILPRGAGRGRGGGRRRRR
ncbi:MAG: GTP-binding protein, partial [Planctomycetota bacterium]